MWLLFGVAAILFTGLNLLWAFMGKEASWFRYGALALTALTVCAFYQADAAWVMEEDWSALMDVTPNMAKILWCLTAGSILVNSISLFKRSARS